MRVLLWWSLMAVLALLAVAKANPLHYEDSGLMMSQHEEDGHQKPKLQELIRIRRQMPPGPPQDVPMPPGL